MLQLSKLESIDLDTGTIYILHSDKKTSIGFLRLDPGRSLDRHNRPVDEWLVQIEGISVVKLYEDERVVNEVTLKRGDSLLIPANQYHQHTNPNNQESLTSWHFDGDIAEVIKKLRSQS